MDSLVERVARTIERRNLLRGRRRIGVAVSGGADSVCLLRVLMELAPRWGLELSLLHLNHQLRGTESEQDAEFVARIATEVHLACFVQEVDVGSLRDNLEQAARSARLEFFTEKIVNGVVELVATGHTRSDQAETVLFRFLRGSGTAGLAGIRAYVEPGIIRPLIDVERSDVENFLREQRIEWRDDSTNSSPCFARNRIRQELLPRLARDWNPAIYSSLSTIAEWAGDEEQYWGIEISRLAARNLHQARGGVLVQAGFLAGLPPAVARRFIRHVVVLVKGDLRGIDFQHVESVLHLARKAAGSGRCRVPALDICRSFDWILFEKLDLRESSDPTYSLPAGVPGRLALPCGGPLISLELIEKSETSRLSNCVYNEGMGCLDWGRLSGSLELRNWRAGDRYQPVGRTGTEKIRTLFQKARVPVWERPGWPVLTDGQSIVWSRRFGPAAGVAAVSSTQSILCIRELAAE